METVGMLRSLLAPQQDCDTSSQHSSNHHHHHHRHQGSASALLEVTSSAHHQQHHHKSSLFDTCHRKIRFLSGGPVAFFGGLVAKARRKDKETSSLCSDEPKLYLEQTVLERKLPDIDLRVLVDLPAGLDYNEWLASHTIAFFDHINLVYGTISEFCTMSGCPDMTGPGLRTYLWFDEKGKKTRVAAPQYIDYVMTFTQKTISDESIFPTKYANEFPSSFESIVRKILRLLFHVLAHLYHSHFREVVLLNLHAHLNCVFAHLTLFNVRFDLIESRETEILNDLVVALKILDTDTTQQQQLTDNTTSTNNSTSTTTTVTDSVSTTTTTTTTATTEDVIASINSTPILPENTALLLANQEVIPAIGH